ncbi:transmembrane protein 231 [Lingula anatina]|uniref:Transmembrane protein 231 n=1 Tax=Lingula anatina TaxID=7574 RepID=A0A1S3HUF0_LINAN|nr:transmembrane protein 231 [Lingula anatina]|eukprot:XP_013388684.1 transmembrane protein 231 [Lingula anatina]
MAVYEVYNHPEVRRYRTNVCSRATYVQLITTLLTFLPPLFIGYGSQGFWQKSDTYQEQPDVHFKHQVLMVLETAQESSYIAWSTYQNFNRMQQAHLRVPIVKSREEDSNRDGLYDTLYLTVQVPLLDTEHIHGVKLLLIFDYKLNILSSFQMESMAYIQHDSPRSGAELKVIGDLRLVQKDLLLHRGVDNRFNSPVIDDTSIYADAYDLANIFSSYSSRNVTTVLDSSYPVWTTGRGTGQPFVITATIRYPRETLFYIPGFWQLIKWAWVQYVAILIIFVAAFDRIKTFIFQNQLVPTIVDRPFKLNRS